MNKRRQDRTDSPQDQGFAAIVVVFSLVIILSLITVGFAAFINREQRQALDNQLSTQAFYAAESGINDAVKAIKAKSLTTNILTDCGRGHAQLPTPIPVGSGTAAEVTCLMVDLSPRTLEFNPVTTAQSKIIPIKTVDDSGNPIVPNAINISWQDAAGSTSFNGPYPNFPPTGGWGSIAPVLRVSVTPLNALDRQNLTNNTFTVFLYPSPAGAAGSVTGTPFAQGLGNIGQQGRVVRVNCHSGSTPRHCLARISLPAGAPSDYLLRVKPLYRDASVSVSATSLAGTVSLEGAQATIDSTGKAQDVLRRIQVRVPTRDNFNFPEYVLEASSDICKRITVGGTAATNVPPCDAIAALAPVGTGGVTAGVADAGTCPPGGCVAGPPAPPPTGYDYNKRFYNLSPAPPAGLSVAGCTWDFDDGSPLLMLPPASCDAGDSLVHTFPSHVDQAVYPFPAACSFTTSAMPPRYRYSVTLMQQFSDGSSVPKTVFVSMPDCA